MASASARSDHVVRNALGAPRVPGWGHRPLANNGSGVACRNYHGCVPG